MSNANTAGRHLNGVFDGALQMEHEYTKKMTWRGIYRQWVEYVGNEKTNECIQLKISLDLSLSFSLSPCSSNVHSMYTFLVEVKCKQIHHFTLLCHFRIIFNTKGLIH